MKKAVYFFIAIALIFGITGCEEDPNPPQITINGGANATIDKMTIDSLAIPIYITGESSLNTVKISALYPNGSEYPMRNILFERFTESHEDTIRYSDLPSDFLKFTKLMVFASSNNGVTRTKSVPFIFSNFGQLLPNPEPLEWIRIGVNDGQGLNEFGLFWDNRITDDFASIQKKPETAKFCRLNASDWLTALTEEAMWAAIEGAEPINAFNDISTEQDKTYNEVLGVKLNSTTYYMLHITRTKVETQSGLGKVVTITGEYQKAIRSN